MSKLRTAVFVDLANFNKAIEMLRISLGIARLKIDFEAIIKMVTVGSELVRKSAYLATKKEDNGQQIRFIDYLKHVGFNVVSKNLKKINQSDGTIKFKGNFDVEISVDVSDFVWRRDCEEIVIFSGDSDFSYLIDRVQNNGLKITIVSSRETISTELSRKADRVILLEELEIEKISIKNQE